MADMTVHEEQQEQNDNGNIIDERIKCLVADSAAFIKNVNIDQIGQQIFTIKEVIAEIRDPVTRQRLAVLPYELIFREPSTESIATVTDFSKKTGDFRSLSATDLRVIALTYQLEKEFCEKSHIRLEPLKKATYLQSSGGSVNKVVGFYSDSSKSNNDVQNTLKQDESQPEINTLRSTGAVTHNDTTTGTDPVDICQNKTENNHTAIPTENISADEVTPSNNKENEDDLSDQEDDDEDDDGGEWITPGNVKAAKTAMGYKDDIDIKTCETATVCLTTDFAMQNVLIQMGLHVLSVDGMLVRQARSYVLKCYGCNKVTNDTERIFCPNCGNKTLTKLAMTVSDDGTVNYHVARRRKPFNIRGLKYSLPLPKGGRHSTDVILTEDQRTTQKNMPRKRDTVDPMDANYVARSSPFSQTDVNSRAFTLGHHLSSGRSHKTNPNAVKKKTGKRR